MPHKWKAFHRRKSFLQKYPPSYVIDCPVSLNQSCVRSRFYRATQCNSRIKGRHHAKNLSDREDIINQLQQQLLQQGLPDHRRSDCQCCPPSKSDRLHLFIKVAVLDRKTHGSDLFTICTNLVQLRLQCTILRC